MKTITLEIPEEKYDFFMELFEQLGVEVTDEMEIPEEHKEIVRERIEEYKKNPGNTLDFDNSMDDIENTL